MTLRSDALVGITLNQLCDLSYLIGMTRPTPGFLVSTKQWDDAMAVLHEAIERGEVVPSGGER